jgi:hypothetical protein
MRELTDASTIRKVLHELARATRTKIRVYLTGGATAVLHGWRRTTIDLDLKLVPEDDAILRAIQQVKETLRANVELAAPDQFIPPLPGWEERSPFIEQIGTVGFYHYDLYSQALAKIERGHEHDLDDARRMVSEGLVEPRQLMRLFETIESELYRYPAIDGPSFRRAVEAFIGQPERR